MRSFHSIIPVVMAACVSVLCAQSPAQHTPTEEAEEKVAAHLARLGTPEAAYHATLMKGTSVQSLEDAKTILTLAATGDARAQFAAWACGIESGDKPAIKYLHDSASQNDPYAVRELARISFKNNPDETVRLLTPLVDKGDLDSARHLGAIRLLRAKTPEETRAAIRLLESAYGDGDSQDENSQYGVRNAVGPMLAAAWYDLSDATPQELERALEIYGKYMPPAMHTHLRLRTKKADDAPVLQSLREQFRKLNTHPSGPEAYSIRRNPHLLALADALPDSEKSMVARAYAARIGDYSTTPEETVGMMRLLLPPAERGESWAKDKIRTTDLNASPLPPDLKERVTSLQKAPTREAKPVSKSGMIYYLSWVLATRSAWIRMPDMPLPITLFAHLHTDLAPLDKLPEESFYKSLDELAAKGDRPAQVCKAAYIPKTDPQHAGALATLKKLADEGSACACLALATYEKDPATRLTLLEKAAKDDTAYACERLALELERQQKPDYARAIAVARRINPDINPYGFSRTLMGLIGSHRELYATDLEHKADLAEANQRFAKAMTARRANSPHQPARAKAHDFNASRIREIDETEAADRKRSSDEKQVVIDWLAGKARGGSLDASLVLGSHLITGESANSAKALIHLQRAAKLGSSKACLVIATHYGLRNLVTTDQRLDYLDQAVKAGESSAYGHIAEIHTTRGNDAKNEYTGAARDAIEDGNDAGDFYCTLRLAERRRNSPRSAGPVNDAEYCIDAEEILLAAKPLDYADYKKLGEALLGLYLDNRYPADQKPLDKIAVVAPEALTLDEIAESEKIKIIPYENLDSSGSHWRPLMHMRALLFAQQQGSPDAAYLLSRNHTDYDTGKKKSEWLQIAFDGGSFGAILEIAAHLPRHSDERGKQAREAAVKREAVIQKLAPFAKKNASAALRLSTLHFAAGREVDGLRAMRHAAILGDREAMKNYARLNLVERSDESLGDYRPDINEGYAWLRIIAQISAQKNPASETNFNEQFALIEQHKDFDARKAKAAEGAIRSEMKRAGTDIATPTTADPNK